MNKKNLMGVALVAVAVLAVGLNLTVAGDVAAKFLGKAVWYLPYMAAVGAARYLVRA